MDKVLSMRVFNEVVEKGSFAKAASSLSMSAAVVTRHVAALEKELGAQLIVRTTRSLALTERGEIYLERTKRILNDIDETDALVNSTTRAFSGMLKLSVPVTFGLHFLPDLLREFRKDYPDINFDVVLTDEPIDFVGSGRDIAVTFATNVTQSDSIVRRLSPAGVMLCATPEYLRDAGPLQAPTDLAAHHCISIAPQRTSNDVWQLQDLDGRSAAVSIKSAIVCNTIAMVHQCVFAHLGIGMFRWLYAKDLIADGRLIRVLPAFEVPGVDLVIAYPNRRYLTSKAQAFIDFLLSRMTAGGFASLTKHEAAADSLATTNQSSQWSENSSR